MLLFTKVAVTAAASTVLAVGLSVPSGADPGGGPSCPGVLRVFCSAAPILPNLDHDVDLTKDPNGLPGDAGAQPTPHDDDTQPPTGH
jgi:hypothetical protein